MGRCKQKQRGLRGLLCRWPSITEWEMYITAQGCRLRNDLYCVEWDVKLYYTIPFHDNLCDTGTMLQSRIWLFSYLLEHMGLKIKRLVLSQLQQQLSDTVILLELLISSTKFYSSADTVNHFNTVLVLCHVILEVISQLHQ